MNTIHSKKIYEEIKGTKRERTHLLANPETKMINFLCPKVPKFIETYHLTYASILASIMLVLFGYLATINRYWIIGVSFALELHFITDAIDGEIGRRRNTGLVRWGFFADHFLDLLFLATLYVTYSIFIPESTLINFLIFILFSLFFFESLLFALVGNKYTSSGFLGKIGPTEITHVQIIINIIYLFLPNRIIIIYHLALFIILTIALAIHFIINSRKLWNLDMEEKNNKK